MPVANVVVGSGVGSSSGTADGHGMVWYGMADVCDGYLAAEAFRSSFG